MPMVAVSDDGRNPSREYHPKIVHPPSSRSKPEMIRYILRANLPMGSRVLWAYLLDRQGDNQYAWPTILTISNDLHVPARTIKRAIYGLEHAGILDVVRKNGGSNKYIPRSPFDVLDEYGDLLPEGEHKPVPLANGAVP